MKFQPIQQRNFLFLQGPPGPFFWQLSQRLHDMGCGIHRINICGGDVVDWPGQAVNYRGSLGRWTLFVDRYLSEHGITDLVLFGDCRPFHVAAHRMAQLRRIATHVFEEGYIRPDWITLEPDGVNGHSTLPRDPQWYLKTARDLPPLPDRPTITASFNRRARDAWRHYSRVVIGRPFFPFHSSHRTGSITLEGIGWLRKLARRNAENARAERIVEALRDQPYFIFPLQLSNDFQIRTHSPFANMTEALNYVLYSFAHRAPAHARLLVKEHPLDATIIPWRTRVRRAARRYGLEGRVVHVAGGDLMALTEASLGMVTINSTSGTLALTAGVPVIALGTAIYDMPGLTHQGRLDDFWNRPQVRDAAIYEAFRRVLYDRCLIYGGLASESATSTLIDSAIRRLAGDQISVHPPRH